MILIICRIAILLCSLCLVVPAYACEIAQGSKTLKPASWVTVNSTPFDASDREAYLWLYMLTAGETLVVPAYTNGEGGFEFMVAASYAKPWKEKPIDSLWLTDGEVGCEIIGYSHGAMSKVPGALSRLLFANYVNARGLAASIGIPASEIDAEVTGNKPNRPDLIGVYETAGAFNTLIDVQSDAQSNAELARDLAVISAYYYASPLMQRVTNQADIMEEIYTHAQEREIPRDMMQFYSAQLPPSQPARRSSDAITRGIQTDFSDIATAAELSRRMLAQSNASIPTTNGSKSGFTRDVAGTVLGVSSAAFSRAGGIGKGIGAVFNTASSALFHQTLNDKLVDGLYPSSFVSIEPSGGPYILYTDDTPKVGSIDQINVTAQSKGLDAGKILADIALNYVPFSKTLSGGRKAALEGVSKALPKQAVSKLRVVVNSTAMKRFGDSFDHTVDLAEPVIKQALGSHIGNIKGKDLSSIPPVPPKQFAPVDILEPGYHMSEITNSRVVNYEPLPNRLKFTANEKGVATLKMQNFPGKYGANEIKTEKKINVDMETGFRISKKYEVVLPGDELKFTVSNRTITEKIYREKPDIEFDASGHSVASISSPRFQTINGEKRTMWTVRVKTSANKDAFPFHVTASNPSHPEYRDTATVERARISPDAYCLDSEYSETFYLNDEDGNPLNNVRWSLKGRGRIDQNGTYTAPKRADGEVVIRATHKKKGHEVDRISLELGCSCQWSLSVDGETDSGESISVSSLGVGMMSNFVILTLDGERGVGTVSGQGHALAPKTTSTQISLNGQEYMSGLPVNLNLPLSGNENCKMPKTDVQKWRLVQNRWLVGDLSGRVATPDELARGCTELTAPFTFSFRADLGANSDRLAKISERLKNGEIVGGDQSAIDMVSAVADMGMDMAACLPEND